MLKSYDCGNTEGATRRLLHGQDLILWQHWVDAYKWDDELHKDTLKVYANLTEEYLDPSHAQLMRNHLATGVLNGEMLHLMKVCSSHVGTSEKNSRHSSFIVNIY